MATAPPLQRIVDLFAGAPKDLRVQALLEYSRKVPPLPEPQAPHSELLGQVAHVPTPFLLGTEVDGGDRGGVPFPVPGEAPTTRGFGGNLYRGLNGTKAEEIL